ncbi:MAG: thiamine pyrophosphate-binding protein [Spirochaetaceae bacterium]|nr:MAG: thiamine pyrophosphate-binding protein [Spirochaetaceae bacterium]
MLKVAESIVDRLKAVGTEYFFLLTGGDQPLWIALHEANIKMVVARSENSAVYMADGYARASGKPAIVYGQAGPGAANVASALADPFWAQTPVIALTGANSTKTDYIGEYQSLEQMSLFAPVTKWNGIAANASRVPDLLTLAIQQAMAGSRGPTHLDVPKDFFGQETDYHSLSRSFLHQPAPIPPDTSTVEDACRILLAAEKPVILAGDGVLRSGAGDSIQALAETLNIPIATTMGGKTSVPAEHVLNIGVIGRYSSKAANDLVSESDCVLVVGSRLGGLATRGYSIPNRRAHIVSINTDPNVFDVSYPTAVKLLSDAKLTLDAINQRVSDTSTSSAIQKWTEYAKERVTEWRYNLNEAVDAVASSSVLSPLTVLKSMSRYNNEITLVADTGYMAAWTGVLFPTVRPNSYFRAIGSLGWAFPASLGVQLARNEKVVCVTGDGGFGYHLADIETAVRYRIPVVIVVFNNNGLVFEYHEQKYRHGGNVIAEANDLSDVDYSAVGRALGAEGCRIRTKDEFEREFRSALENEKPTVLDVVIDREAFPPVTNFERVVERTI